MAQSFWKRRKDSVNTAGSYIKATEAVSRPTAFFMTLIGILVVGGLLFGVFWGARWSFDKLSGNSGTKPVAITTSDTPSSSEANTSSGASPSPVSTPPVTVTSSTATTTPSAPAKPPTIAATTENLPYTGPASNAAVFFAVLVISYLAYRKKLLSTK